MNIHFTQENTTGYSDDELYRMNEVMTTQLESEGLPPTKEECEETGDDQEYLSIMDTVMQEMDRRIAKGLGR